MFDDLVTAAACSSADLQHNLDRDGWRTDLTSASWPHARTQHSHRLLQTCRQRCCCADHLRHSGV